MDEAATARPRRRHLEGGGRLLPDEPRPAQGVPQHVAPLPLRHEYGQDQGPQRDEAHVEKPAQDGQGHPQGQDDGHHPRAQQAAALHDRQGHAVTPVFATMLLST